VARRSGHLAKTCRIDNFKSKLAMAYPIALARRKSGSIPVAHFPHLARADGWPRPQAN
jgi:hypothetical protein